MPLVERHREIDLLADALDASGGGRGRLVVVTGPPGTGKTALCREAARSAADRDHVVVGATGSAQSVEPYGIVAQLLESAARSRDSVGVEADPVPPDGTPQEWDRRLHAALTALAADSPVLVLVDALDQADTESVRSLLYCANRLRNLPAVLLVNETGGTGRPDALRGELRRHPECHRIRLGPLSRAGTGAVVSAELPGAAAESTERCHTLTGGNPRLVQSVLEDSHAQAPDGAPRLVAGEAFRDAVRACLRVLAPDVRATAEALAVVPDGSPSALLTELTGLEPEAVSVAATQLAGCGLADGSGLRSAVTDIVLGGMDQDARTDMRRRTARFLLDRGTAAETIAPLLRETGPEAPWVVSVLWSAADRAREDGDTESAVDYLNHAHRASRDDVQQNALHMDLLRVRWDADPSAAVHHLSEMHEAAVRHTVDANDLGSLVRYLAWHGRFADVRAVLATAEATSSGGARSELDDARGWLECTFPGVGFGGGDGSGSPEGPAPGLLLRDVLTSGPDVRRVREARQFVLAAAVEAEADLEACANAVAALLYCGELEATRDACERILERDNVRRSGFWRARFHAFLADVAVRSGDMRAGADLAQEALTEIPLRAWGQAVAFPRSSLLRAATALDDLGTAERLLHTHGADGGGPRSRIGLLFWHARGHYYLATGQTDTAIEEFRNCGEQMIAWGLDHPEFLPWRGDLAQAELDAGELDSARALAEDQLKRIHTPGSLLHTRTTDLLARMSSPDTARILGLTAAAPPRLEIARAQPAGPDDDTGALSEAELRVGSLAALGSTNREISRRLFITVSTVEQHLTRIYRKLGVRRRSDLPRELVAAGEPLWPNARPAG